MPLRAINKKGYFLFPSDFRKKHNITEDKYFEEPEMVDGKIVIKPALEIPTSVLKGLEQPRKGQYKSFNSVDDLFNWLDSKEVNNV